MGESVGIELPASHYNFIKYYDNLFLLLNCCTFVL